MGEQQSLPLPHVDPAVPEAPRTPMQPQLPAADYVPFHEDADLIPNCEITLIHRTGRVKTVRFEAIVGPRIYVRWPVCNEQLAVSLRLGYVVDPRRLREWRLEPAALAAARRETHRHPLAR